MEHMRGFHGEVLECVSVDEKKQKLKDHLQKLKEVGEWRQRAQQRKVLSSSEKKVQAQKKKSTIKIKMYWENTKRAALSSIQ